MIKHIGILRLSALGDVIMLVPLIRTLQYHFPQARITWFISEPAYSMLEGLSGVDLVKVKKPKSLADYRQFRRQVKPYHFDVLLATQASFRANLMYPLIKAKRKIGYDKARANDGQRWFTHETINAKHQHTLEGFIEFAKAIGAKDSQIRWDLPLDQEAHEWANQHKPDGKVLAINAAASKAERSWSLDKTITVIKQAIERWSLSVVLTGGPTDLDKTMAKAICEGCIDEIEKGQVINLVGQSQPKQLIALLSKVDCLLCPDTGPAHMATAVNTPVVGLYAVNPPHISGPYLSQHLVVDKYPQAVKQILGKALNEVLWTTRVHSPLAMDLITVEDVMEKLTKVFA